MQPVHCWQNYQDVIRYIYILWLCRIQSSPICQFIRQKCYHDKHLSECNTFLDRWCNSLNDSSTAFLPRRVETYLSWVMIQAVLSVVNHCDAIQYMRWCLVLLTMVTQMRIWKQRHTHMFVPRIWLNWCHDPSPHCNSGYPDIALALSQAVIPVQTQQSGHCVQGLGMVWYIASVCMSYVLIKCPQLNGYGGVYVIN